MTQRPQEYARDQWRGGDNFFAEFARSSFDLAAGQIIIEIDCDRRQHIIGAQMQGQNFRREQNARIGAEISRMMRRVSGAAASPVRRLRVSVARKIAISTSRLPIPMEAAPSAHKNPPRSDSATPISASTSPANAAPSSSSTAKIDGSLLRRMERNSECAYCLGEIRDRGRKMVHSQTRWPRPAPDN